MKILLTGANGYIGRRLLPALLEGDNEVVAMVRDRRRIAIEDSLAEKVTFYEGDLLKKETLEDFPPDIDVAYYLVHSMGASYKKFAELEAEAASNFSEKMSKTNARQIIYLSGIVNDDDLSEHLQSRKKVEDILREGQIPVTVLRAAIIIGSGGASFEIIRDLVEKLPVMVAPRWVKTRCQPISLRNVLQYLEGVLLKEEAYDKIFDIGGPEVLTYKQMLLQFAKVRKLKRYIITVPVLSPHLSSLWLYFVTSTSFSLARSLVDSMINEVVVEQKGIKEIVPVDLLTYEQAVQRAFDKIAQNEVISSWKDSLNSRVLNLSEHIKVPKNGCLKDVRTMYFEKPEEEVLNNIWSIGGERGWYYLGFLWKTRGVLDKMMGGVGLRRGRRSANTLVAGDALDFWRVLVADKKEKRLLLYAEMKLPGEAWLEFKICKDDEGKTFLLQTATYRPQGLPGRLYWYAVLPFHAFIFPGMARRIIHYDEQKDEITTPA